MRVRNKIQKVSENDHEIPQSHTTANQCYREEVPQNANSDKTSGRKIRKSNQLTLPRQDDCKDNQGHKVMHNKAKTNTCLMYIKQRINNNRTTSLNEQQPKPSGVCVAGLKSLCLCARLFICALWSPAGKVLTSWLSFMVSAVSLSLSHWYPGSVVVLDCIDS